MSKKILITNFEMRQFAGSEINASTIAKRFKELGYEVYMLAMYFGEPIYAEVKENFDYIIDIKKNDFDFTNIEFDIVWAHHSFLLNWLIFEKGLKAKRIIASSLSPVVPFEFIPNYANDLSLVLANSKETKEALINEGIKEVHVLENYSFKKYFEQENDIKSLKNIAIVSNHIPQEVKEAKKLLESNGYNVQIYGIEGKRELIDDKILKKYDAIISIGKTVQYAMSLQIPIYVYDIHGGEGYITLENLEKNREKNFSGRGFEKKSAKQIYTEIIENFSKTLEIMPKIKEYAYQNFCFENNIDKIIEIIENKNEIDMDRLKEKYKIEKRSLLIPRQLEDYLVEKYEDILRVTKHELHKEISRLTESEENLRQAVIEKDKLIKVQEDIIKAQEDIIKAQKERLDKIEKMKIWKYIKIIKRKKE